MFALFPMVPLELGLAPEAAWRASSAAFLLAVATYLIVAGVRQADLRRRNVPVRRAWAGTLWTIAVLMVCALAVGVLGYPRGRGAGVYVAALFLGLTSASIIFGLIVGSALRPLRGGGLRPSPSPPSDP